MEKLGLFDLVGNINQGVRSKHLFLDVPAETTTAPSPDSNEKVYAPFMINRALSQFSDTILLANMMNQHGALPVRMQYDFLRNVVRPRKRFGKWAKAKKDAIKTKLIMERYNYNSARALEVLDLFSESDIKEIKKELSKGGKS